MRRIEASYIGDAGRYELRGELCRAEPDAGLPARVELDRVLFNHGEIDVETFALLEGYVSEQSAEAFLVATLCERGVAL